MYHRLWDSHLCQPYQYFLAMIINCLSSGYEDKPGCNIFNPKQQISADAATSHFCSVTTEKSKQVVSNSTVWLSTVVSCIACDRQPPPPRIYASGGAHKHVEARSFIYAVHSGASHSSLLCIHEVGASLCVAGPQQGHSSHWCWMWGGGRSQRRSCNI